MILVPFIPWGITRDIDRVTRNYENSVEVALKMKLQNFILDILKNLIILAVSFIAILLTIRLVLVMIAYFDL